MKQIKAPIEIIINSIKSDNYFTGTIRKGYGTSARINVPSRYADKKFILVILDDEDSNGKVGD